MTNSSPAPIRKSKPWMQCVAALFVATAISACLVEETPLPEEVSAEEEVGEQSADLQASSALGYYMKNGAAYPKPGHSIYFVKDGPTIVVKDSSCEFNAENLTLQCHDPFDRLQCTSCGNCKRTINHFGAVACQGSCTGFSTCSLYDVGEGNFEGAMEVLAP